MGGPQMSSLYLYIPSLDMSTQIEIGQLYIAKIAIQLKTNILFKNYYQIAGQKAKNYHIAA